MGQWEAFALTLALEIPVAVGIAWLCGLRDHLWRVLGVAVAASLLTHPVAWFLATSGLADLQFWWRAAVIEIAVVAAEAIVYRAGLKAPWKTAAAMSLAANAVSFGGGLWLARLL